VFGISLDLSYATRSSSARFSNVIPSIQYSALGMRDNAIANGGTCYCSMALNMQAHF